MDRARSNRHAGQTSSPGTITADPQTQFAILSPSLEAFRAHEIHATQLLVSHGGRLHSRQTRFQRLAGFPIDEHAATKEKHWRTLTFRPRIRDDYNPAADLNQLAGAGETPNS